MIRIISVIIITHFMVGTGHRVNHVSTVPVLTDRGRCHVNIKSVRM